jgi:peptidoglycan/xylan/chitin deacetylase (PgdA/CDA1 family)
MFESGNGIINMGNSYINISKLSKQDIIQNFTEGNNKIEKLINSKIELISCPYNEYNNDIIEGAKENNWKIVTYSIKTLDYQEIEENIIWDNIKNEISPGKIIEMNSNTENILEEIKLFTEKLAQRGYKLVNLNENIN